MVLARDRPIFSFEVHASARRQTAALLHFVDGLGYQMLLIREICGVNPTCRNVLCVPPSLDVRAMPALELALASGRVVPLRPPFGEMNSSFFRYVNTTQLPRDHEELRRYSMNGFQIGSMVHCR